jgi:hypothetical protein
LAARFNYDLEAIYRDIKQREKEREEKTGRKFVSYPPRRIEPAQTPAPGTPVAPVPGSTTLPERSPAPEH